MNKQFVKWMSIFLLLPLGSIAQNLPYDTPAFKAIEKKLKINKRQVYWDFYTTQAVQGDSLNQLIVFPLVKREQGAMKLDLYVINYHTAKQKIESYYKGENQWTISEDASLRGLEIVPTPQQLNSKTPAYQLRAFFSNSVRYNPTGRDKEEITSHFTILPHKVHGFFALMEHRSTKQIRIIPDAEGFCTEELSNQQEAMIEWQYNKKEKHYKPN